MIPFIGWKMIARSLGVESARLRAQGQGGPKPAHSLVALCVRAGNGVLSHRLD